MKGGYASPYRRPVLERRSPTSRAALDEFAAAVAVVTTRAIEGLKTNAQDLAFACGIERREADILLIAVDGEVRRRCEKICQTIRQGGG